MILVILFLIFQVLFGFFIYSFFDPKRRFPLPEKVATIFLLGTLFSSFLILLFSLLIKSLILAIFLFFFFWFWLFLFFGKRITSFFPELSLISLKKIFFSLKNFWFFSLILILTFYSLYIFTILSFDQEGHLKSTLPGWGDSAFHLSLIENFATREPFHLSHPLFQNSHLTYPFLINFHSAIFRKLGADQVLAFRLPILIFGWLAIFFLFSFGSLVLKSKGLAILSLIFILWGSGLGFFVLFEDLKIAYQNSGLSGVFQLLKNPPHEYTHLDNRTGGKVSEKDTEHNIVWIVPIISFLSHQRSFVLGLAIFSFLLLAIYFYGKEKEFWRFGMIAGLLPFSHGHSFLAIFFLGTILFFFFLQNWKSWLGFFAFTFLFAFPQLFYFLSNEESEKFFFRPWFGWMTCDHKNSWFFCSPLPGTDTNPFFFWSKNFGLIFFIWFLVLIFLPWLKEKFSQSFLFSSFFLFLLPNLFLFQPWEFDNGKIFFYWWILAIIFAFLPLSMILWQKGILAKILILLLFFFSLLAGIFDFSSKLINIEKFGYEDSFKENQKVISWIKENLAKDATFLAAPNAGSFVPILTGRSLYLGYEGWLWSQGLKIREKREKAEKILAGDLELACQEGLDFIILDEELKKSFPNLKEKTLFQKTKTVFSEKLNFGERKILKINCRNSL